ncbi:hypothetical protein AAFF_G00143520 [Aldrovandia affinis]|uniref:Uncharacterized protein n=1 Tax=Aldrovandia affinis TaxID=143900 RepID=A0AAD7T0D5_9TELE|nr:hypothetical protein AAFF_G00143520 [Aldrovandia affinis]
MTLMHCLLTSNKMLQEQVRLLNKKNQARHYKTLQEIYRRPKPNKEAVSQLRDLEYEGRRVMKPPVTFDVVEQSIQLMRALPEIFYSPNAPLKKMGSASEALLHVFEPTKSPNSFLKKQPLPSPVLVIGESNCVVAVGSTPATTFSREKSPEGLLYLMAFYYTFHMTYPKCIATILSVLQTEVLQEQIQQTCTYKKAMFGRSSEWKKFVGE